jgi:hypothetical protein
MSNRLVHVVQALDAGKLRAAVRAHDLAYVNVKPLLWIVADKTNDQRLEAGAFWSQEKMAKMLGCSKRNIKWMQDVAEAIGLLNVTHRKVEGERDKSNILVLTREVHAYIDEGLLGVIVGETVAAVIEWVQELPPMDETIAGSGCKDCGEVGATVAAETKYSNPNGTQEGERKASSPLPITGDGIEDLPVPEQKHSRSFGRKTGPVRSRPAKTAGPLTCRHSYPSRECPHCLADKGCKTCHGWGLRTIKAPTERDPMHEAQTVCECTGLGADSRMGIEIIERGDAGPDKDFGIRVEEG